MIPPDFKNFYDRINDYIPNKIVCDVSSGVKKFNLDAYDVKCTYSEWVEEVVYLIDKMEGISKKNKQKIKDVVNAKCLSERERISRSGKTYEK